MGLAVKETAVYVKDAARSARFYAAALGLEPIALVPGRHAFFKAGKGVFLCFQAKATRQGKGLPAHGATGSVHAAFEVPKAGYAALKRRVLKHAKIELEKRWSPKTRSFYFRDPDKNLIEVIEPGFWEQFKPLAPKEYAL